MSMSVRQLPMIASANPSMDALAPSVQDIEQGLVLVLVLLFPTRSFPDQVHLCGRLIVELCLTVEVDGPCGLCLLLGSGQTIHVLTLGIPYDNPELHAHHVPHVLTGRLTVTRPATVCQCLSNVRIVRHGLAVG